MGELCLRPGEKYGKLTVEGIARYGPKGTPWYKCACDCGGSAEVTATMVLRNHKRSCGCGCYGLRPDHIALRRERFDISGEYGVYTFKGHSFKFDLEDYERISRHLYVYYDTGVQGRWKVSSNDNLTLYHVIFPETPAWVRIVFLNGDIDDYRKANLRLAVPEMAQASKDVRGVSYNVSCGKWMVQYKNQYKGVYNTYEEAVERRRAEERRGEGE